MGTILESVNNLSEKLGVEEREQTIKDQLDLCVERLGGEGYSADIAESANKFADKEDGTATFTTKSITENGTYAASDDGVSGYSSVSVDVSGGGEFNSLIATYSSYDGNTVNNGKVIVLKSSTGEYEFAAEDNAIYVLVDPAVTIHITGVDVTDAPTINAISFVAGADSMDPETLQGLIKIYINNTSNSWTSSGMSFSEGDSLVARLRYYSSPGGMQVDVSATNEGVTSHTVVIS